MKRANFREFSIDNASILFLSLIRPHHTNTFRLSLQLRKPVDPEFLQQAVNNVHPRFPSVMAALRQEFFQYRQVASAKPPTVRPDPGLLIPMSKEELADCGLRVYYLDNTITVEVFHALTDGHGMLVVLTALAAEYLRLRRDHWEVTAMTVTGRPQLSEVVDSYWEMSKHKPHRLPSRFSYLLPRPADADWQVRSSALTVDTQKLLDAAHRYGVTLNTLLTTLLAHTVMQMQQEDRTVRHLKPVRIMVPVDIRKLANSATLRNCSLYALPTMEAHHRDYSLEHLCQVISGQLQDQLSAETLSGMASYNVRTQNTWYFKLLPWKLKAAVLRLGYRFFGESNSSLTLTNLGRITLPEELRPHVTDVHCFMTPRVTSPYGCTVMTFGDKLTLNMSRFCPEDQLGQRYFEKILSVIEA